MRDNCGVARIRRRIDRTQCLVRSGAGSSARFQNDDVGIVRAVEDGTALIAQAPQKFVLGEGRVTLNKIALAAGEVDIPDAIEVFLNHKLHRSAKNEYAVKFIAPKKNATFAPDQQKSVRYQRTPYRAWATPHPTRIWR